MIVGLVAVMLVLAVQYSGVVGSAVVSGHGLVFQIA